MKILFYSCHNYIKPLIVEKFKDYNDLVYTSQLLDEQSVELSKGMDVISVFSRDKLSREILKKLSINGVRLICTRSTGFNHIDLDAADEFNIQVARVSAYSPEAIAEHTMAILLHLSRKLSQSEKQISKFNFDLDNLVGFNLNNKTIGIIGLGNIGQKFANIASGFGSKLLAYDQNSDQGHPNCLNVTLDRLLQESDIISLHIPLNKSSSYLIDYEEIQKMKTGAVLLNTSRGQLINTREALAALKAGKLKYLGLDVYENENPYFFQDHSETGIDDNLLTELIAHDRVFLTGHQAFLTDLALDNIVSTTLNNVQLFEKNQRDENFLN